MSFREMTMTDVRELLRRYQAGQSARQVARAGVADRKTAARYFQAAAGAGVDAERVLDEALIADVAQRVQGRPEPEPSAAWLRLVAERERIKEWPVAPLSDPPVAPLSGPLSDPALDGPDDPERPRRLSWATLMKRTWGLDVLTCVKCGGGMELIAVIEDQRVAEKILLHLGLPARAPPRGSPWRPVQQQLVLDDLGRLDGIDPPDAVD